MAEPLPGTGRRPVTPSAVEQQRAVATLILTVISGDDFALAGSGALREHGLIDRPTQDVDVFTIDAATERFQGRRLASS